MATYSERPWVQHYDPGIPSTLVYPEIPLHDLLTRAAREHPEAAACLTTARLPWGGHLSGALSYRELAAASDALTVALEKMGLQKGERVALLLPNCTQFVIAFYAALKAGGVIAAVNPALPPGRLQHQLVDSGAAIVITLSLFYQQVTEVRPQTPVRQVIITNLKEYFPGAARWLFTLSREVREGHRVHKQPGDHWFQDLLARYRGRKPSTTVQPDDTALFQYTGGTTGVPKAAVSTHRALVADTLQYRTWLSDPKATPPEEEILLAAIPLFHVFGMIAVMSFAVSMAAMMVMVSNPRDMDEVLDAIKHHQPTMLMGVPSLYSAITHHPRVTGGEVSLRSLHVCISGSAPLPLVTKERFEALSGGKLLEGFGMSEMPTATHANPRYGENRAGSIGLPFPDVECRIVSLEDSQTEIPVGEIGELVIRGPQMMIGYHDMPEETADALRPDAAGRLWLYTGDIARMDEDGYFYIVDRKKDMAIIGGFNVYPRNVEDVLSRHPAVGEVGVAAIPHPDPEKDGQETLKAWIVLKPGQTVTVEDLMAFAGRELARFEVPSRYEFVSALPRSAVGKVLRRELIRQEMQARGLSPQ